MCGSNDLIMVGMFEVFWKTTSLSEVPVSLQIQQSRDPTRGNHVTKLLKYTLDLAMLVEYDISLVMRVWMCGEV